jgi:hypothetical protein
MITFHTAAHKVTTFYVSNRDVMLNDSVLPTAVLRSSFNNLVEHSLPPALGMYVIYGEYTELYTLHANIINKDLFHRKLRNTVKT